MARLEGMLETVTAPALASSQADCLAQQPTRGDIFSLQRISIGSLSVATCSAHVHAAVVLLLAEFLLYWVHEGTAFCQQSVTYKKLAHRSVKACAAKA